MATTPIYRHSGGLGDIIYSLSLFRVCVPGEFLIALNNCEKICNAEYGYGPIVEAKYNIHKKTMTVENYEMLKPLLEVQPYITDVKSREHSDPDPENTVNLDDFRITFSREYRANYVKSYYYAFKLPCSKDYELTPWLHNIEPIHLKKTVCCRTVRYRCAKADQVYKDYAKKFDLTNNGLFVGQPDEHEDFERMIEMKIPYHPVKDFLEMAQIIKGAQRFLGNQTFAYSLAYAMGVPTILETRKEILLKLNECYFQRDNCTYF